MSNETIFFSLFFLLSLILIFIFCICIFAKSRKLNKKKKSRKIKLLKMRRNALQNQTITPHTKEVNSIEIQINNDKLEEIDIKV